MLSKFIEVVEFLIQILSKTVNIKSFKIYLHVAGVSTWKQNEEIIVK